MNAQHSNLHDLTRSLAKSPTGSTVHQGFDGDDPSWAVVATDVRHLVRRSPTPFP